MLIRRRIGPARPAGRCYLRDLPDAGVTLPMRIGIAGYGVVGKRRRNVADQRDDMKVVAVCDQYFEDAGEMEDGVRYYPHFRDLLTEDLDASVR